MLSQRTKHKNEKGIALPFVIWLLALLGLLAVAFSRSVGSDLRASIANNDWVYARNLAQAGTQWGLLQLLNTDGEDRQKPDGSERGFLIGNAELRISIIDENGKIDLNRAPPELVAGLFKSLGLNNEEANASHQRFLDWADLDNDRHPQGAEKEDYEEAGSYFLPRNRPITNIYHMQNILELKKATFNKLLNTSTVYSIDGRINKVTSSKEVLNSIPNMDASEIEVLLDARIDASYDEFIAMMNLESPSSEFTIGEMGPAYTIRSRVILPSDLIISRDVVVWITPQEEIPYKILDVRENVVENEDDDSELQGGKALKTTDGTGAQR